MSILTDIKNVFDETQTDGLNVMLDEFYQDLQTLSENAGDIEFSSIARSSAQKVTETLNQYASQLSTIMSQETSDMGLTVNEVNTLLGKINKLNVTMKAEKLQGNATNELSDTRNLYLDQLSSALDIKVEANDDGTVSVKCGDAYLLDAKNGTCATLSVKEDAGNIHVETESGVLNIGGGSLYGSMQILNGKGSYASAGENSFRGICYYKSALDDFAKSFAETFNTLNGADKPLFSGKTAGDITISSEWLSDANAIKASESGVVGAHENILKMISAMDTARDISPYFKGTFDEFTLALMTDVGIDLNYETDISNTSELVRTSIENQRESVMGVSLNEETVNLLQYQKAFEASSRFMTALDEALDIIINRMGIVGR